MRGGETGVHGNLHHGTFVCRPPFFLLLYCVVDWQALERDVAGQKVVDEVRTEAYLNKKYRQQRLLLKQQQQQQQGQAQAQGQEQGQKQAQAQGQEQGQGQAQLQAQAQEQGQKQAQAQGQAQGQEQGQKQAQGQGQGQGQLSQADEAAVLPGEATEGLPGAKAGPLGEGAAPELVSAPEEQELGQQAAGAGLSDAELEEGEELVQQAAGAELSDVELEEGEEAGLSLLQEEAVSKWSQPYKPNFWDRHPALEGRLQAARGECLALVKQVGLRWGTQAGKRHGRRRSRSCGFGVILDTSSWASVHRCDPLVCP